MKILLVITRSHYGGAQQYLFHILKEAKKRNLDISIALGGNESFIDKLKELDVTIHHLKHMQRSINPLKEIASLFELYSLFKKEKPDTIHLNSSKIGLLGSLAGRLAGIRNIIFTIHGLPFVDKISMGYKFTDLLPALSSIWMRFSFFLTFIMSHKIISVSEIMSRHILSWPTVKKKHVLIRNAVPVPEFHTKEKAREHFSEIIGKPISNATVVIGTFAELRRNKGITYLIQSVQDVIQKHNNCIFLVGGTGALQEELQKEIEDRNLTDKIHLLGFVQQGPRYLQGFDIFVLPSLTEALSLALLEVGHAGLPTVATNVAGTPELIIDKQTGLLIEPKQPQEISRALLLLLNNTQLQKEYGQNFKNHISENFDFQTMLDDTINQYTPTP